MGAMLPRGQRREGRKQSGAEVPVDPDHVPGRVHAAMVRGGQVTPHRQNQVMCSEELLSAEPH
jgi:hypothetical protein